MKKNIPEDKEKAISPKCYTNSKTANISGNNKQKPEEYTTTINVNITKANKDNTVGFVAKTRL